MSRDGAGDEVEEAMAFALGRAPDVPGVGRLCQELLGHLLGREVASEKDELLRLDRRFRDPSQPRRKRSGWSEERRAKVELTWARKREGEGRGVG